MKSLGIRHTLALVGILFFCSFFVASAQPLGLIGWWKGDHNANDVIGKNNGTLLNGLYVKGVVGQAFSFDPDASPGWTGVPLADRPAYALTNTLSIAGWIKPTGNGYNIFWRGDSRPGTDPYFVSMGGGDNLTFYICEESGDYATVAVEIPFYRWTHFVAVFDGSMGTMALYTNGVLAAVTLTDLRPFGELEQDASPGVGIGNVNDGSNDFPFIGAIDEIALFNRALSPLEVQMIYRSGNISGRRH